MTSVVEQIFGIHPSPGANLNKYPVPPPISPSVTSYLNVAEYNLWYGDLYAAATSRPQPSPLDVCSFGTLTIDAALLRQIAPAPQLTHHKPPAVPKLSTVAVHQGGVEREKEQLARQQQQTDQAKWKATLASQTEMIEGMAPWIGFYAHKYEVSTIPRISAFLGNTAEESNGYPLLSENLTYTHTSKLQLAFKHEFPTAQSAEPYLNNPEALANYVYSDKYKKGLGNGLEGNGNGWRYRGRGILQITGLANYRAFSRMEGVDAVSNPDLLLQPRYAVASAFWYWNRNDLSKYADRYNFFEVAYLINRASPPRGWFLWESYRTLAARTIIERMLFNVAR